MNWPSDSKTLVTTPKCGARMVVEARSYWAGSGCACAATIAGLSLPPGPGWVSTATGLGLRQGRLLLIIRGDHGSTVTMPIMFWVFQWGPQR